MSIEINGELILNQKETDAFIRNMIQPNLEDINRRNVFLRDRDDIVYSFSEDGVIAECDNIDGIVGQRRIEKQG